MAFAEHVLSGVAAGVLSALCMYPLEVRETKAQGKVSAPGNRVHLPTSNRMSFLSHPPVKLPTRPRPATLEGMTTFSGTPCVVSRWGIGRIKVSPLHAIWSTTCKKVVNSDHFRGFDMALGSALAGYTAFFGTMAVSEAICSSQGVFPLLLKNSLAASVSCFVNSPFQLLKTLAVLCSDSDSSSSAARAASLTNNGRNLEMLWSGAGANALGAAPVAVQFTLFNALSAQFPGSGAGHAATLGALATAAAGCATYPVAAIRTSVMTTGRSVPESLEDLTRKGALYSGWVPFMFRTVPPAAMLFALQSTMEAWRS